ncbi:MAG TPA: GlsB/YeaQ/YmgE family stress response membrane protein [Coriobacteriia bacterium]
MGITWITWIFIGLIAGVIAKLVMGDSLGWILTILLGILGASVGGWVLGLFGGPSVTGFNLMSIVVAAVGAVIVLFIYGLVASRR